MAINNKDDYGKLAKLLYPSIEASGNVYYGQTKKLTMDEILGKNELNFESHIESFKQGDQTYKSYFNWRLGPLHESIRVLPFDVTEKITLKNFPTADRIIHILNNGDTEYITDSNENLYGTVFAKYTLSIESTPVSNVTNSGSFVSYENNINLDFVDFILTESKDPTNTLNYNAFNINNRNFYISKEAGDTYLYIQVVSCDGLIKSSPKRYEDLPFTIELLSGSGTVRFLCNDYLYKTDGSWENYSNGAIVNLDNVGDTLSFKKNNRQTPVSGPIGTFVVSGNCTIKVYGCAYSLLLSPWHSNAYYTNNCFESLFEGCTQLVDASNLIMPNAETADYCCNSMFKNCTGLIYPPQLNSYYLDGEYCYLEMFNGCSSLKYAPQLPAESLTYCCYEYMFGNCSSLEYAPYLPATTLAEDCYHGMFANCTNLKYIQPILPATTISQGCYWVMFSNCQRIKCAPILPARSLANRCYQAMFSGCESLEEIVCLADDSNIDDILDPHSYVDDWLYNVTSSGLLKLLNNHADFLDTSIPNTWSINILNNSEVTDISEVTVIFPKVGFNCKLSNSEEPDKYYSVITSGSDSDNNGRGKLTYETSFNMAYTNPIFLPGYECDKCDTLNGNSNQEIWGYKCFNSPVSFRNGIYNENAAFTSVTNPPSTIDGTDYQELYGFEITSSSDVNNKKLINIIYDNENFSKNADVIYKPISSVYATWANINNNENDTLFISNSGIRATIPSFDDPASCYFNKEFGEMQQNGASVDVTSKVVRNMPSFALARENVVYIHSQVNEDGVMAGCGLYLASYSSSATATATLNASDNIYIDTSVGDIKIDSGNETIFYGGQVIVTSCESIIIDDDDIDERSFTSEKDCLVLGNTRNNNSGALVINTRYSYDTMMAIDDTIPVSAEIMLSCAFNDEYGSELEKPYIKFTVNDNESSITISSTSLSVDDGNNVLVNVDSTLVTPLVSINGDAHVSNDLSVSGDISVSNDMYVLGNLTVTGTVIATDQATDLNVSGDLHVTGDATIDGQVSVGGVGTIKLGGNNDDALEIDSSRGYDIILNAGSNAVDIQSARIYLSALDSYVTGNLSINGSTVVINGASLTGNDRYFAMDKSLNVSGLLATDQVIVSEHIVVGLMSLHPYYVKTYQGELHIGDTLNANDDAVGGTLKVDNIKSTTISATTTTSGIVATRLQFSNLAGQLNMNNAYPVIHQSSPSESDIPLGAIIFARVISDTPVFAGDTIPPGATIQLVDLCKRNETFWAPTPGGHSSKSYDILQVYDNNLAISTIQPRILYATFTPITRRYDSGDGNGLKYQNLAIIMRVQ